MNAVHDVSDGGAACAAAEMALSANTSVQMLSHSKSALFAFFAESQGRFLIALPEDKISTFNEQIKAHNIVAQHVGDFISDETEAPYLHLALDQIGNGPKLPLSTLRAAHEDWLPNYMKGEA